MEGINDGQTLGKMVVGIRIVEIDKTSGVISRCTMRASAVRNLARIIDGLPFYYIVGLISIADSGLNQRLGDFFAETIVLKLKKQYRTFGNIKVYKNKIDKLSCMGKKAKNGVRMVLWLVFYCF